MTSSRKETSTSTPDSSSAPNPSSAPETFDHSSNNSRNYPEQKGAKFRLEDEEEDENFVEIPDSPDVSLLLRVPTSNLPVIINDFSAASKTSFPIVFTYYNHSVLQLLKVIGKSKEAFFK